ncbi:hypothetical protein ACFVWF_28130 [Rhodococcus qingshengii]|uniref:hypothetical protein n=1 Tax=Rhodococcus qingshengii TaxID=334542 RepID=UPI0036DC4A84
MSTLGLLAVKAGRQCGREPGWSARIDGQVIDSWLVRSVEFTLAAVLIVVSIDTGIAAALACATTGYMVLRGLGVRRKT